MEPMSRSPAQKSTSNILHLISLSTVPIPFYEWDGSEWQLMEVPTGGLSHPLYIYEDRIPDRIRGVITLSFEYDRFMPRTRVVAHEIGHKLINVSHEGRTVCPSFEATGPELMLYYDGEVSGHSRCHRNGRRK